MSPLLRNGLLGCAALSLSLSAAADENLFGYVKGAETLPQGSTEFYQFFTLRNDKGQGTYRALDSATELEHGVSDRFTVSGELKALALDTSGLSIDGYLPGDKKTGLRLSGLEVAGKYNFLSPAKDDIGLSGTAAFSHGWIDLHSGERKKQFSAEFGLQVQKYFLEGQLVWVGNATLEATYAKRRHIDNLPAGFDWPQDPEMEIEPSFGTGLSYRFAPGWFAGAEMVHQSEYETEVGKERWSLFAGPTLHFANQQWWATATYFHQVRGGGEAYAGQSHSNLHLVEKTRNEFRIKLGYNF